MLWVPQEKDYIFSEARKVFREHRVVSSEQEVEQLVRACSFLCVSLLGICQVKAAYYGRLRKQSTA